MQLFSRGITLNPLHGIAAFLEARLLGLDLAIAARMDRTPALHVAAALATAAMTVLVRLGWDGLGCRGGRCLEA